LEPRQGQWPLEPVNGFVLRGGPTVTSIGPSRTPPENKPQLIDCKGLSPLLGSRGKARGGFQGGALPFNRVERMPLGGSLPIH
jgi:hypothetical protein